MASASNEAELCGLLQEALTVDSEKFAIAAHMHVVMRRTTGRVTDVEWMVKSPEYAREIVKAARAATQPDLHRLADKLEMLLQLAPLAQRAPRAVPPSSEFGQTEPGALSDFSASLHPGGLANTPPPNGRKRYVGTLR
jgi:hypothetical protein